MSPIGIQGRYRGTFPEALTAVGEALKSEGFGILTEIDVSATLDKKLGVQMRPYKILGACNPPLAHEALKASPDIGLLLPCNVVVYEQEDGAIAVRAIDPMQTLATHGDGAIGEVARKVREKLVRVIDRISAS
jgi:uncharacterized protein (DUF302 family)